MSGLSPAGETLVLTTLLTGVFMSLHATDPGADGATEVSGGDYARQSVGFSYSGADPVIATNNAVIQFPTALSEWGQVGFFGIWDAVSGGTFRGGWPVKSPKFVGVEDIVRWDVGKLRIASDEVIVI